ncbi:Glutathione S-transferase DHAR2 [Hordeum vulgare]|nr:Glutathione S-transferase DHAR2 [Hordeum vulgare]
MQTATSVVFFLASTTPSSLPCPSSSSPAPSSLAPASSFLVATMPPRPWSSSGFRRVRAHPFGVFYTEIRSGDMCLRLGTSETVEAAVHAYDTAVWWLSRACLQMNILVAQTREEAQARAPPRRLITA